MAILPGSPFTITWIFIKKTSLFLFQRYIGKIKQIKEVVKENILDYYEP